jgi:gluconolactonase
MRCWLPIAVALVFAGAAAPAADLPDPAKVKPVELFTVPHYCEGVVFDHQGRGYVSEGATIVQFTLDGQHRDWAKTGAPNGHKILADGAHLICDAGQHAVLRLSADGQPLEPAAAQCAERPIRGPNDLTLDTPHGGFYFSDPGESSKERPIGAVYYVDAAGKVTPAVPDGLAFPNGIVLTPDGKKLYLAESQRNRVLVYEVQSPGKLGPARVFAELPTKDPALGQIDNQPDGMCLDAAGNLYVAHYGMQQVQVLDRIGKLIGRAGSSGSTWG